MMTTEQCVRTLIAEELSRAEMAKKRSDTRRGLGPVSVMVHEADQAGVTQTEAVLDAAVAEYLLDHPMENVNERYGRHAAVRGLMVRLGVYAEFEMALCQKEAGQSDV